MSISKLEILITRDEKNKKRTVTFTELLKSDMDEIDYIFALYICSIDLDKALGRSREQSLRAFSEAWDIIERENLPIR